MKNTVIYFIVFLFSIALCYESINYCYQSINDQSYCEHHDLDCEENKTESKSSEKTEKEGVLDEFFSDNDFPLVSIELEPQRFKNHNRFSSADYSQVIYSPPELILL